jgi:hypothetical protein
MNSLDILVARQQVNIVHDKIALSLSEIASKRPDRVDIIESMTESKKDLENASIVFFELEREFMQSRMLTQSMVTENLKLLKKINEIEDLSDKCEELEDELIKLAKENELLKKRLSNF